MRNKTYIGWETICVILGHYSDTAWCQWLAQLYITIAVRLNICVMDIGDILLLTWLCNEKLFRSAGAGRNLLKDGVE